VGLMMNFRLFVCFLTKFLNFEVMIVKSIIHKNLLIKLMNSIKIKF